MAKVREIAVNELHASTDNVRAAPDTALAADAETVGELAESIQRLGLLSPILVQALPSGGYAVVAGQRRLAAVRSLGHETILAFVTETDAPFELSIHENMHREPMSARQKVQAVQRLLQTNPSTAEVAKIMSVSTTTVRRYSKLAELEDELLDRLDADGDARLTIHEALQHLSAAPSAPPSPPSAATGDPRPPPLPQEHMPGSPEGSPDRAAQHAANLADLDAALEAENEQAMADSKGEPKPKRKRPLTLDPWIYDSDGVTKMAIPKDLHRVVSALVLEHLGSG